MYLNPNLPFFGNKKNRGASYMRVCHFFKPVIKQRDSLYEFLIHNSIRFENEKKLFNLISLCKSYFRIVREGVFLNFYRKNQLLLIIWPTFSSYISACTYTRIIWCMHLHPKTTKLYTKMGCFAHTLMLRISARAHI